MAVTININDLSLVHKDSGGIATATAPDVCNTPGAGPIPYPNIARSVDLKNGTRTIKVDGGNPAAIYGSEFYKSTGDEPGTIGGVKSGVNMSRATWITYSFDVKFEGKGACRLTDKMFMNNGNTVCLAGVINPPVFKPPTDPDCARLYEDIYRLLYGTRTYNEQGFPQGTKGLAYRWNDIASNENNWKPDMKKAQNHLEEYQKNQKALKDKVDAFKNKKKRNCNDDDLPPGAEFVADENNVPELGPGKPGFQEALEGYSKSSATQFNMEGLAKTLGVSVGVAVAVEVISRIIRLIPPLWPLQASPI
jgi:hypothetical protein